MKNVLGDFKDVFDQVCDSTHFMMPFSSYLQRNCIKNFGRFTESSLLGRYAWIQSHLLELQFILQIKGRLPFCSSK